MRYNKLTLAVVVASGFVWSPGFFPGGPALAQVVDPPVVEVVDVDLDGIDDSVDECLSSDVNASVMIGSCDSGVANSVLPSGCTLTDMIVDCAEGAKNHGKFVNCVARTAKTLKRAGMLTKKEKGKIQKCAAKADLP